MDKRSLLFVSSVVVLMSMQSCTTKNPLPSNPKAGQEYKDDRGNRWTWNPLGYWIVYNSLTNGGSVSRYYPSTNTWTNSTGIKTSVPNTISPSMNSKLTNSFTSRSYKANSTTTTKSSTSTSSSSGRRSGGFGTSSRSSIS